MLFLAKKHCSAAAAVNEGTMEADATAMDIFCFRSHCCKLLHYVTLYGQGPEESKTIQ